jgi:type IX secretion system substrate protein
MKVIQITKIVLAINISIISHLYSQNTYYENIQWNTAYFAENVEQTQNMLYLNLIISPMLLNKEIENHKEATIDSIIVKGIDGSLLKTMVTYNINSIIDTYTLFYFQENNWINYQKVFHEFNSEGKLTLSIHKIWNGVDWENFILENFEYDSLSNLTVHLIESVSASGWINSRRNLYSYNSNGELIKELQEVWGNGNWFKYMRWTNEYYSTGQLNTNLVEEWNGTNWISFIKNYFEYDKKGKLVNILNKKWISNAWQNNLKKIFLTGPDESVHLIKIWENNNWNDYDRTTYSYTDEMFLISGIYEYYQNGTWLPGEGSLDLLNPDGFEIHFIANEMQVFYNGITDVENDANPLQYALSQNFPNPFNPTTNIKFSIPQRGYVKLVIYNLLGEVITILVDEVLQAGNHIVPFNAENLNSGIYIYRIESAIFFQSNKMILLK